MRVHELINRLEDLDPDAELRFAYQSSWPLQDEVKGVWTKDDDAGGSAEEYATLRQAGLITPAVVYIVSAGQDHDEPYAPRAAFQEAW